MRSSWHSDRADVRTDGGDVPGDDTLPDETPRKPGSSGVPLPLTEVRIVAQAGVALAEVGEIEIRGPTVFAGYIGGPCTGIE